MLKDFINHVNSKIGLGYAWGGSFDKILDINELQRLVNTFGREHYYFSNYSTERWIGKYAGDCSDLILYGLRKDNKIRLGEDYTAEGIFTTFCKPIIGGNLKAGDLCFTKNDRGEIVHIGMYNGANRVTHARSTFYGVCNTQLFDSFNVFGRLKCYENAEPVVNPEIEKNVDILFDKGVLTDKIKWLEKGNKDKDIYWLITKMAKKLKGV